MTLDSSGSMVAYGKLAGLPSEHLVMVWKNVDLPTLARPTCAKEIHQHQCDGVTREARTCRTYDPALQVIARATQKDLLLLDFLLGRHSFLAGKSSKLVKGDENCRTGCLGGKRKLAKLRRERNTKIEAEHTHAGTCLVGIGGGVWGAIWLGAVVCKILTNKFALHSE